MLVLLVAAMIGAAFIVDRVPFTMRVKSIYILAGVSIYMMVYLVARSIYRYKRYGTIRREKHIDNEYENSSAFSSLKASVSSELPKELAKRYENINRKRRKRKRQEITPKEYMELLRNETKKLSNTKGVMIFYIIFTIAIIMITAFTTEPADTLLFAALMCTIEYSIYRAWKKVNAGIVKAREEIFDDCMKKKCNIIEYAKEREKL